jgi:hypothetical protein
MSNWRDDAIVNIPKMKPPHESWWARPELQRDRLAFQRRLVDEELDRISGNARFGGHKTTHDKFQSQK